MLSALNAPAQQSCHMCTTANTVRTPKHAFDPTTKAQKTWGSEYIEKIVCFSRLFGPLGHVLLVAFQ